MKSFLVKEEEGLLYYSPAMILSDPSNLGVIDHPIRIKILKLLEKQPMYAAELAKYLKMHEQKVYYHIKQLLNANVLELVEKKEIRGTIAKRYKPKVMNFSYPLSEDWKLLKQLIKHEKINISKFLYPFIKDGELNCRVVVGSPDPHGPFKAFARDGHYGINLALFLGQFCDFPKKFSVNLDVDIKTEKEEKNNLIIIGGPGINMLTNDINNFLPAKFNIQSSEEGFSCSGILSEKTGKDITGRATGMISRIRNPYNPEKHILILAGVTVLGSKAAIIGLTRYTDLVLNRFTGQESYSCVVEGLDLDGDGKIDSIEVVE